VCLGSMVMVPNLNAPLVQLEHTSQGLGCSQVLVARYVARGRSLLWWDEALHVTCAEQDTTSRGVGCCTSTNVGSVELVHTAQPLGLHLVRVLNVHLERFQLESGLAMSVNALCADRVHTQLQ
jgi:hypothetical protein